MKDYHLSFDFKEKKEHESHKGFTTLRWEWTSIWQESTSCPIDYCCRNIMWIKKECNMTNKESKNQEQEAMIFSLMPHTT